MIRPKKTTTTSMLFLPSSLVLGWLRISCCWWWCSSWFAAAQTTTTSSIALTPSSYNCEALAANFQVRWSVDIVNNNDVLNMELLLLEEQDSSLDNNNVYMSFGVSGEASRARMVGGDVVVADYWGGTPRAVDYLMSAKDECSSEDGVVFDTGVCPEDNASLNGFTNDIANVSGVRDTTTGLTLIQYQRPATLVTNVNDLAGSRQETPVDQAIDVTPGVFTTVIWALGLVQADTGYPSFHSIGYSEDLIQFEFGRQPVVDNCVPLVEVPVGGDDDDDDDGANSTTSNSTTTTPPPEEDSNSTLVDDDDDDDDDDDSDSAAVNNTTTTPSTGVNTTTTNNNNNTTNPYVRPVLTNVVEFRATIGPAGGVRGYQAITGGRTPSEDQVAWYINDILIPVIELRRGTTYTFYVNGGGNNNNNSAGDLNHPFYLTTSIAGGYNAKTRDNNNTVEEETILAGLETLNGGASYVATTVGPLCRFVETNESAAAAVGGYLEYFASLDTSCASNTTIIENAGVLQFTPDATTPDLIYYQSVTQTNLGWKMYVIDANAPSILSVDCETPTLGATPLRLTSEMTLSAILDPVQNVLHVDVVLNRLAWLAVAFTKNGRARMVGSEAVIGFPSADANNPATPAKFNINSKSLSGVVPMPAEQQTLTNATVTQTDTTTVLKFTKALFEEGEHPIYSDRPNIMLFAYGANNAGGVHISYGQLELLPNQCAVYIKDELQNGFALSQNQESGGEAGVGVAADLQRNLWVAHGVCAAIAWGILVPLAIGASLIRQVLIDIVGWSEGSWFQLHRGLNVLAALLTVAAFAIAVRAINQGTGDDSDPDHFDGDISLHRRVGLIIFILTLMQAINGALRPSAHGGGGQGSNSTSSSSKDKTQEFSGDMSKTIRGEMEQTENGDVGVTMGTDGEVEKVTSEEDPHQEKNATKAKTNTSDSSEDDHSGDEEKSMLRRSWEIFHRLLGFALLGLAWWQVQDGLAIFALRFDEDNMDTIFWIVVACISGLIGIVAIFGRLVLE
ncbi:hypothetical protein ACA910_003620 [Epithemia clementina (nom. ined.)]